MKEVKNRKEFEAIISGDKPVLLDFYADWCGPCQAMLPILEKLSVQHESDFQIAKVNVDSNRDLAMEYGVRSIPALFFIQNGEVKETLNGLQTETVLHDKMHRYSAVTTH